MVAFGSIIWMIALWFVMAGTGMADDPAHMIPAPPDQLPWWISGLRGVLDKLPEINAWLFAVLMFLMVFLRGLSELLAFIAEKTENKSDDKWAAIVAKLSWWASAAVGWFGGGKSKKLIEKASDKTNE